MDIQRTLKSTDDIKIKPQPEWQNESILMLAGIPPPPHKSAHSSRCGAW